jgi:pyruvate dehydrogenase E1 component
VPNVKAYDPAYAYELAVMIRDGIRRMYSEQEDVFYYITVENEPYPMPVMPPDVEEGILRGMYKVRPASSSSETRAHLFGSGAILNEALAAQEILAESYNVAADVWSITSFKELYMDGTECDRFNRLHRDEAHKTPWIQRCLGSTDGVYVIASDYVKALPYSISKWFPRTPVALGTDGFGRSESRAALRRFFEVDAAHIVVATLGSLAADGKVDRQTVESAIARFGIDPDAPNPVTV